MVMFCSNCGQENEGNYCSNCGHRGASPVAASEMARLADSNQAATYAAAAQAIARTQQRHGVPALLSFFIPGLGQLIKGDVFKGIVAFIGMGVSIASVAYGIGFFTTPVLWVWQVYDAYTAN